MGKGNELGAVVHKSSKPKPMFLEIRVLKLTRYGVQLEATSSLFDKPKIEFMGKDDIWIFSIPMDDGEEREN